MKKLTFILILALVVSVCALGVGGAAMAAVSESECDLVFLATLEELLEAEEADDTFVSAEKTLLYDMELEPLGYLYAFSANGVPGYAVVINADGVYECTELYFDAVSPYAAAETYPIYANTMAYLTYAEDVYYEAWSGTALSASITEAIKENALVAAAAPTTSSETIYYSYKTDTKNPMVNKHPYNVMQTNTDCVPAAGTNIIQFYDRTATNLIANYTPCITLGTAYIYNAPSATLNAVNTQLSSDMGGTSNGVTVTNFITGMSTYCTRKGYTFSYSSCMSSGSFNFNTAKTQMQAGKPVILFVNPYAIQSITENSGNDYVTNLAFTEAHAMVAFGSREITYTLTSGGTRNDKYLQVASSVSQLPSGYCKIGSTAIDNALAVTIA